MNNQNSLRLDTNIASQIDIFRQYGADGELMKSILFLLAFKEQCSLIKNVGCVDTEEIATKLGLSKARLMLEHPNPAQFIRLREQFKTQKTLEERLSKDTSGDMKMKLFDNVLENALYRLNTESLRFEEGYRHYVEDGNKMVVQTAKTIQFLSDLEIRKITTPKGQSKYVYDYKLSKEFMTNFALYFSYIDIDHVNQLRPKNLDDLYIFLMNLRNTLKAQNIDNTSWYSFDRLCELANINFQMNENATTLAEQTQHIRDKKRALTKKFEMVDSITNMGVSLSWTKTGGQVHAYTPVIRFDYTVSTLTDPNKARAKMMLSEFCRLLIDELTTLYPSKLITEDNAEQTVLSYVKHKSRDESLLKEIFKKAHKLIFKDNEMRGFEASVNNLPYHLLKCESMDQLCDILNNIWKQSNFAK